MHLPKRLACPGVLLLLASCGGTSQGSPPSSAPATAVAAASKPAPAVPSTSASAALASATPAASAGAKAAASASGTARLAYVVPSTLFVWEDIGLRQHLFEKNGLQVSQPVLVSGTPRLAQALIAGDFEAVGTGLEPSVTAAAKGTHIEAIASLQPFLGMSIVVPADSPIKEPAQLKGKNIGLSQIGNSGDNFLGEVLTRAGVGRNDVTRVQTGSSSAAMTALVAKKLDAAVVGPTDAILGGAQGARTLIDGTEVKVPTPQGPVVVNKAWAESHRPECWLC